MRLVQAIQWKIIRFSHKTIFMPSKDLEYSRQVEWTTVSGPFMLNLETSSPYYNG